MKWRIFSIQWSGALNRSGEYIQQPRTLNRNYEDFIQQPRAFDRNYNAFIQQSRVLKRNYENFIQQSSVLIKVVIVSFVKATIKN